MKKLVVILSMAMCMGSFISINAQMNGSMKHDTTHRSGMHKNMMQQGPNGNMMDKGNHMRKFGMSEEGEIMMGPIKQLMPYIMLIKKLPEKQDELGLTDDQVSTLVDLQTAYKKEKADLMADLIKKELKLKNLLKSNASSKEISNQLTACAASKVSIGVAAYETANNMKNILTDAQKQKLERRMARFHSMEHNSD